MYLREDNVALCSAINTGTVGVCMFLCVSLVLPVLRGSCGSCVWGRPLPSPPLPVHGGNHRPAASGAAKTPEHQRRYQQGGAPGSAEAPE